MTYEDFSTCLHQVEAILNSRPISPLSTDPSDDTPLTPAHFLIGRMLTTVADHCDVLDVPEARLSSYQRIQACVQGFWRRWHHDYLNQLQQRTKWQKGTGPKLEIGDLVLLHEQNVPPMRWKLGRIVDTHRGGDDILRVVSVKTKNGVFRRAVSKVSPLVDNDAF